MFTMEPLVPRYAYKFGFEKRFRPVWGQRWMARYWTLSILLAAIYMYAVYRFSKRKIVPQRRQSLQYRLPLFVWDLALCFFSLAGVLRTFPELAHSIFYFGFHHTACDAAYLTKDSVAGFWTFAAAIANVTEMADVLLLLVMGRQVTLTHGMYRSSTLVGTWFIYAHKMATLRWFVFIHFFVNIFTYAYYASRALKFNTPRVVAFTITATQVLEMVAATYFSLYAYLCWWYEEFCDVTGITVHVTLGLHFVYFIMFMQFFYFTYLENIRATEKKQN